MPYDRDSFLAGLSVGRTLWRPHSISETNISLINCFVCGAEYPLNWVYTRAGVDYIFKTVNITIDYHEQEITYWLIWNQPASVGEAEKVKLAMFVPAGGWEPQVGSTYYYTISGELENGERMALGSRGITFNRYASSTVARYRTGQLQSELDDYLSPEMWKNAYRYFNGYPAQLTSFMENAQITGSGNNLYLIGEVT